MTTSLLDTIDADLIEPQRLAESVIDQLTIERRKPPTDKPRGISAREALIALRFEAQVVALAAHNIAAGICLTEDDKARLMLAWGRIEVITTEVA